MTNTISYQRNVRNKKEQREIPTNENQSVTII